MIAGTSGRMRRSRAGLLAIAALALAPVTGCLGPSRDASFVPDGGGVRPPSELFGRDAGAVLGDGGGGGGCPDVVAPSVSRATVSVTTLAVGGRYQPRNVGAIWIEDVDGHFVRTLEQWGMRRRRYLTTFLASSAGNLVDAITGATLRSHGTHTLEWDLRDAGRCPVGRGDYRLDVEITDRNSAGAFAFYPFTLPTGPSVLDLMSTTNFHDVRIAFE